VKSDIDEEPSQLLAQKYGVRGVPTLLLLDSTGKEIGRGGFMSSPETVKFLKTPGAKTDLP
jgi:thioredoxin-related protein